MQYVRLDRKLIIVSWWILPCSLNVNEPNEHGTEPLQPFYHTSFPTLPRINFFSSVP